MAKKLYSFLVTGLFLLVVMFLLSLFLHWLEAVARGIVVPAWY